MSRRSVSHRGAGIFGARHLTMGLALGLALSVTAIASPAGATPQGDLESKTAQAKQLEATIQAILSAARTGEVGDGKIFVQPLDRVVRIRTGERDVEALTPVTADEVQSRHYTEVWGATAK